MFSQIINIVDYQTLDLVDFLMTNLGEIGIFLIELAFPLYVEKLSIFHFLFMFTWQFLYWIVRFFSYWFVDTIYIFRLLVPCHLYCKCFFLSLLFVFRLCLWHFSQAENFNFKYSNLSFFSFMDCLFYVLIRKAFPIPILKIFSLCFIELFQVE